MISYLEPVSSPRHAPRAALPLVDEDEVLPKANAPMTTLAASTPIHETLPMSASPSSPPSCALHSTAPLREGFRLAMRQLASGVSIVTHGAGEHRVGLTATSVSSLSLEPPTLIVCVNRSASLHAELSVGGLFGVSVLGAQHTEIADRFAGRTGLSGAKRFDLGCWTTTSNNVSLLADALAA